MILPVIIACAVVLVSGVLATFVLPRFLSGDSGWHISWRELIVGTLLACFVVTPSVLAAGSALSVAEALRYEEFRNGVEKKASVSYEDCRPGYDGGDESSGHSNCAYEYNTGQTYSYQETYYESVRTCDSDGDCTTTQVRKERTEYAYIYNPYATKEYSYVITDSLDGTYRFPGTYVKDGEGYGAQGIPDNIPRGDPAEWTDAWQRIEKGDPRPVTRLFVYDNYILASKDEQLVTTSKNVEKYLEEGILPEHTANIMSDPTYGLTDSYADKVSFVGVKVADEAAWQSSLMTFNAALGSSLRGDMHIVFIDSSKVDEPDDYLTALKAYWLGEDFGRRAIAKNAIIVVIGVRGDTIQWAKASTGMPRGNEVMLEAIERILPDTPLEPAEVIGAPRTVYLPDSNDDGEDELQVTLSANRGALELIVLSELPFKRACMTCSDDEGEIGYSDLVNKIQPNPLQWGLMIGIVALLSFIYWGFAGKFMMFNWIPGVRPGNR